MKNLKFWLPMNGYEQEIIVPGEGVESVIVRSGEHEAGHVIVAHHFGAMVWGIAVGLRSVRDERGMYVQALYALRNSTVENECVVKAAGPAADLLFHGGFDEISARGDLQDIENLTGQSSFEPFLETAKAILQQYTGAFRCITSALRYSLEAVTERNLVPLPTQVEQMGALLLNQAQLMTCLSANSTAA